MNHIQIQTTRLVVMAFVLAIGLSFSTPLLAQLSGGSGTVEDPYLVATLADLDAVRHHLGPTLSNHFRQIADIDASPTAEWNDGAGFEPIGTVFLGTYDGGGFRIRQLTIHRPGESVVGLFRRIGNGSTSSSWIFNGYRGGVWRLTLESVSITGEGSVGAVVGSAPNADLHDVHVSGTVSGSLDRVGGLAGSMSGRITESTATDIHVSGRSNVGGLVGELLGRVERSYATGTVTGTYQTGGLVGMLGLVDDQSGMQDSYSDVLVSGGQAVGGLVGSTDYMLFTQFKPHGTMPSVATDSRTYDQVYAFGSVTGGSKVGAMVGEMFAASIRGHWNQTRTGSMPAFGVFNTGSSSSHQVSGLDSIQMTGSAAATHMSALDFESGWRVTDTLPVPMWPEAAIMDGAARGAQAYAATEIGKETVRSWVVRNIGSRPLQVSVSLEWNSHFELSDGAVPFELQPGEAHDVSVVFRPTLTGTRSNMLNFSHNAVNRPDPYQIFLVGSAIAGTSVYEPVEGPQEIRLLPAYPNPFNPSTQIRWTLDAGRKTRLSVYDLLGREVAVLADGVMPAGSHQAVFDGANLASGLYIVRLEADGHTRSMAVTLMK